MIWGMTLIVIPFLLFAKEASMRVKAFIGFITLCVFVLTSAFAHSGRTDKYGGHNNRKTGGYHYHNAGRVHVAGNPYQDHTKCGICTSSKKKKKSPDENTQITDLQRTFALQAGL